MNTLSIFFFFDIFNDFIKDNYDIEKIEKKSFDFDLVYEIFYFKTLK